MTAAEWARGAFKRMGKYRYALAVMLLGVLLLVLPLGSGETAPAGEAQPDSPALPSVEETERKLEKLLSAIEGAGEVKVMLTLRSGPGRVLARNGTEGEVVMVSQGAGVQEPVTLVTTAPGYQGALVVAPGAEDPQVRLELTRAVSALTGLGADKISVCKSNS